ncbi:MAG: hypothetical protein E6I40_03820 [Chloroflexi bacterium]|nr:MAG: hypothetical protein AUI58_06895 [Chloroflexi bacterium 13_1_40CM_2_70_6]TME96376.1 MAG: hypothetical protein E6I40_03820 [Chloroflexota bacterium]TMG37107.1 MAG: hypothetical protein E6H88_07450 [Chloroflexota bacterium]
MSQLWDLIEKAMADAVKAERLMVDGRARRALRTDPDRMLRMFDLHAETPAEEVGFRQLRAA